MAANSTVNGRYLKLAYTTPAVLNLTMMIWVYSPAVVAQTRGLITQIVNASYGPNIRLDGSDGLTLDYSLSSATSTLVQAMQAPTKTWFHVAMTVSSSGASSHVMGCYYNGKLLATQANTDTWSSANSAGFAFPDDTFATQGYLRDARIWARALSGTEVALEYASPTPRHRQGLVLWAPMDRASSLINENLTATGTHLTSVGGTTAFVGLGGTRQGKRPPTRRSM